MKRYGMLLGLFVIILLGVFHVPAVAKTDIFGQGREVVVTYNADVLNAHVGFLPFWEQETHTYQQLAWGLSSTALMESRFLL